MKSQSMKTIGLLLGVSGLLAAFVYCGVTDNVATGIQAGPAYLSPASPSPTPPPTSQALAPSNNSNGGNGGAGGPAGGAGGGAGGGGGGGGGGG